MLPVVLNIDAGELEDEPAELYALAHVVNVACGGHAGDEASMGRVLDACKVHGTRAGAHPSYPDRAGFGRTKLALSAEATRATVAEQCERLLDLATVRGLRLLHVKPHGALYHAADADPALAAAVVGGAIEVLGYDAIVIGPAGGAIADACAIAGVLLLREAFADRGVLPNGKLVPRGQPGDLVTDPAAAAARATELVLRGDVDTICVHGDTPDAVEIARAVRRALG